jgi:hypothetical protein
MNRFRILILKRERGAQRFNRFQLTRIKKISLHLIPQSRETCTLVSFLPSLFSCASFCCSGSLGTERKI